MSIHIMHIQNINKLILLRKTRCNWGDYLCEHILDIFMILSKKLQPNFESVCLNILFFVFCFVLCCLFVFVFAFVFVLFFSFFPVILNTTCIIGVCFTGLWTTTSLTHICWKLRMPYLKVCLIFCHILRSKAFKACCLKGHMLKKFTCVNFGTLHSWYFENIQISI